jgi:SnoaL-like polyketide cyclase
MITIAREQVDSFSTGDWERLQTRLTADSRYHELGTQRKVESPEQIVELFKGWKTAFPDAAGTVTSAVGSGNTAALEVTWKGTHTGPFAMAARARRPERAAVQAAALSGDQPVSEEKGVHRF